MRVLFLFIYVIFQWDGAWEAVLLPIENFNKIKVFNP